MRSTCTLPRRPPANGHGNVKAARALIQRRAKDLGVDVTTQPGFGEGDGDDDERQEARATMPPELQSELVRLAATPEGRHIDLAKLRASTITLYAMVPLPSPPASRYDDGYDADESFGLTQAEAGAEASRMLALADSAALPRAPGRPRSLPSPPSPVPLQNPLHAA